MTRNKYSSTMIETERRLSALHRLLSEKTKVMVFFSKPLRRMGEWGYDSTKS
jgi:hypothetical protein